jgi:Cd2+/Zn2+-exporting ATPase
LCLAGTINLWGAVEVSVLRPAEQSSLQKIIQLIKEAQQNKAPSQRFADRFSTYYTYVVLGLSLVMFFVWWLIRGFAPFTSGPTEQSAFYHAMTLLVVASPVRWCFQFPPPCWQSLGARHGVLFREAARWKSWRR